MNANERGRYLLWLREVLNAHYIAQGIGWQDSNRDLDEFLDGFYDAAYEQGRSDALEEF